eukprot:Gb_04964 [translate_table: standard]
MHCVASVCQGAVQSPHVPFQSPPPCLWLAILQSESGGRVALPVGNEYTMYSMVGSSRLSNLHQSFFIHDQPLAFQLDNLFSQRRPHLVCRNKTSTVSILKSVMPDVIVQESSNEHTPSGCSK